MYTHFYGFSQKPFPAPPDPKYFFLTDTHQKTLEAICYGIAERKGFIYLSGEAGTGKTTILQQLVNTLDKNIKTVFIAQARITPKQLFREIAGKLGISLLEQSKTSLILKLQDYLLSALPEQGNLAILIDEAQNLSPEVMEELRMLSNLETSTSKLIQIVLAGQPQLDEKLNSREHHPLKQRIAIRGEIRPLTAEESFRYIDYRLKLVGSSAGEIFSPEAAALIGRHAGGIPRTVNLLCDNALLLGYRRKEKRIPAATVKEILSDRGMVAEEEGKKRLVPETASTAAKKRVRRAYPAAAYWGIAAALAFGLIFLGSGGHFGLLAEKMSLVFAKNEAAAVLKEPVSPLTASERIPEPVAAEEKEPAGNVKSKSGSEPAAISPPALQKTEMNIWTAEEGETLYFVLRKHYGRANPTLLDYLLAANPEISNPHTLTPGCRIQIPVLAEESLIRRSPEGDFQVHLATFAGKEAAEAAGKEMRLLGKMMRVESCGVSPRETWHRVLAVGYNGRDEALEAAKAFRKMGLLAIFPIS